MVIQLPELFHYVYRILKKLKKHIDNLILSDFGGGFTWGSV